MRMLTFATLALAAAGCNLRTCSQLESFEITNNHYAYAGICAMPYCRAPVDFRTAENTCKLIGARLCTMSEIQHDVAKGVGCSKDTTNVWTATECEGGHVSMAGSFIGSREEGMGPQCRDDLESRFDFICCSSDDEAKACVQETAEECESDCCKDLEITYNPVPCKDDYDCQSCVPMQRDRNGVYGCNPEINGKNIHMKKMMVPGEEGEEPREMCCSMEPEQTKCHLGYCTTAPCMGEGLFDPQWPNVRGDEWSRAECQACHHNGCDQCKNGFFKNDYSSACVACDVMKNCQSCHDFGCNQCKDNSQPKKCDNLRGARRNTCCDSGEKTMCVKSTTTLSPLPPHTPATPQPGMMQTPEPVIPQPTPQPVVVEPTAKPNPRCERMIGRWGNCQQQWECCEEGLACVVFNPWYAQCLKATDAPKPAPTMAPKPKPTMAPTAEPTMAPTAEPTMAPTQVECSVEETLGCGQCWANAEDAWACSCEAEEVMGCDFCWPNEEEAGSCTCTNKHLPFSGCGSCWATKEEAVEC